MGLALGYEDLNDHDQLRRDPVLALLSGKLEGRRRNCGPLSGKSTLNRLEHAPPTGEPGRYHRIEHDPDALQAVLLRHVHRLLGGQAAAASGAGHRLDRRRGPWPLGGCGFWTMPITDSDSSRSPIPTDADHGFRMSELAELFGPDR